MPPGCLGSRSRKERVDTPPMTLAMSAQALPSRYEAWNQALSDYFFNPHQTGRPTYLQVDVDTLQKLAPTMGVSPEDVETDFVNTVRSQLYTVNRAPFQRIANWMYDWQRSPQGPDQSPPCIAMLGLCVLAASRMHRDHEHASHNYYVRLNELLGWRQSSQPRDFDRVVTPFWDRLNDWLDNDNGGRLGVATATPSGRLIYIGYPLSQCLLRDVDRDRLPDFFAFARINPGAEVDPEDLIGPLLRWCQGSTCSLSSQAQHLVQRGSSDIRLQIARVVVGQARVWHGEIRESTGRRTAPIVVCLNSPKWGYQFGLELYPRHPQDFPSGIFQSRTGSVDLQPLDNMNSEWYEPLPLDVQQVLDSGIELRRGLFAVQWMPTRTIALRLDEQDLGGYVSQTQVGLGESVIVLTRDSTCLEHFLDRYAAPGWKHAPGAQGLPHGWHAYLNVAIQKRAYPDSYPAFTCLIPTERTNVSLDGGLKLDATTWLTGGEPILRVSGGDGGAITVEVDGTIVLESAHPSAELDLSSLDLAPNHHTIVACGRSRHFHMVRSGDYAAPRVVARNTSAHLANVMVRDKVHFAATSPSPRVVDMDALPSGQLSIMGTHIAAQHEDLPENLPRPVTLVGGARLYVLLGLRPGMVYECHDPAAPPYRRKHQLPSQQPFVVEPPFQVAWVVRVSRRGRTVQLNNELSPIGGEPYPEGDVAKWKAWLLKRYTSPPIGDVGALWQQYVRVAESLP